MSCHIMSCHNIYHIIYHISCIILYCIILYYIILYYIIMDHLLYAVRCWPKRRYAAHTCTEATLTPPPLTLYVQCTPQFAVWPQSSILKTAFRRERIRSVSYPTKWRVLEYTLVCWWRKFRPRVQNHRNVSSKQRRGSDIILVSASLSPFGSGRLWLIQHTVFIGTVF
jgi:hypothetical protein